MKKNWMKKLSAALCAATLFASGLAVTVNAANEKIKPFEWTDYKNLVSGSELTISSEDDIVGSVQISKTIANPVGQASQIPVDNVEFTLTRVGEYAVVEDTNGNPSVMIGIHKDVLKAITGNANPEGSIAATVENGGTSGYVYLTSKVYNNLNENYLFKYGSDTENAFDLVTFDDAIDVYIDNATASMGEADKAAFSSSKSTVDGIAKFETVKFGIYLVRETDVYNAVADVNKDGTKENVYFSKKQHPYLLSVPYSVDSQGNAIPWNKDVQVNAKNDNEPITIDKLIVRDSNTLTKGDGNYETDDPSAAHLPERRGHRDGRPGRGISFSPFQGAADAAPFFCPSGPAPCFSLPPYKNFPVRANYGQRGTLEFGVPYAGKAAWSQVWNEEKDRDCPPFSAARAST